MKNTPEIKTILVPIAIGKDGTIALKQAMIFQKLCNCKIILLHVLPKRSVFHLIVNPNSLSRQKLKAERELEKFTKRFYGGEIPPYVTLKVVIGSLIQKILITAERTKCDLIIIKKKKRIVKRFTLSKTENADKLISGSVCPVITISKRHTENGINNILIPVDVTKRITNKIAWAKYLALNFNAKIHVISVLDIDIAPYKSLAHRKALEIERSITEVGLEANVVIIKSHKQSMHDVVLKHISKIKPDLVLTMTHQESILLDNYIGKFASEIIHRSNRPVFSIAPKKENMMTNILDSLQTKKK